MKVALVTPFKNLVVPHLKFHKIEISNRNPDVVVAFGGDGTFLLSEEKYPSVPKVFIKYHRGEKVSKPKLRRIFSHLLDGRHKLVKESKVEASVKGKGKIVGLNEINVHYKPPKALRFSVDINGRKIADGELVGDGLLVSTPYGSTAYFHSITGKTFGKGLGVAFNNLTKRIAPKLTKESSKIRVKILRGEGTATADCSKKVLPLKEGDHITIKKHPKIARVLHLHGHNKKASCR